MKRSVVWLSGGLVLAGLLLLAGGVLLPAPATVTLEWKTASEVETVGFLIYRSETPTGPYTRITPQLIPAADDPLLGGQYRYEDTSAVPGQTYYYQLEDVETDGTTTRHGPIEIRSQGVRHAWLVLGLLLMLGGVMLGGVMRGR